MSSIYKSVAEFIKENMYNKPVINAYELNESLVKHIDLSDISDEEKDRFIIGWLNRIVLNTLGYRSIERRKGIYVNPELMGMEELSEIIGNIDEDINAHIAIKKYIQDLKDNCEGQMRFDSDMEYKEEMTTDELYKKLLDKYAL